MKLRFEKGKAKEKFDELKREMRRCQGRIDTTLGTIPAGQQLSNYASSFIDLSNLIREYCALSFTMVNYLKKYKSSFEDPENIECYLNDITRTITDALNHFFIYYELLNQPTRISICALTTWLNTLAVQFNPAIFNNESRVETPAYAASLSNARDAEFIGDIPDYAGIADTAGAPVASTSAPEVSPPHSMYESLPLSFTDMQGTFFQRLAEAGKEIQEREQAIYDPDQQLFGPP
ncbi:hypothetical protein [Legionella gresilensis]|uniref:hypothetical protein n=1 Tax=Legionella gresilensis TaxID=91823 RepID=UPI001041293B|nr:hypothetical protein [Legionella gresilensis]